MDRVHLSSRLAGGRSQGSVLFSENMEDLESLVVKLRKKLEEASHETLQEEKVWKILCKLGQLPMSLELLQVTHIGKQVNGFKKQGGRIGQKAKELVNKWKELIPDKAPSDKKASVHPASALQHSTPTPTNQQHRREARHRTPPSPPSLNSSQAPAPKRGHSSVDLVVTSPRASRTDKAMPLHASGSWSTKEKTGAQSYIEPEREDGLASTNLTNSASKKRKGALLGTESLDSMALTKRSRTQVYSGKKTITGPQRVPSLFDLCMDILADNIDAIEEVGGIPCSILEPVLQKCTPTQLMRLESFNPHFIEDTDGLWEKHCKKEFKQAQVVPGQTWRDFYLDQLSERETRLKNIAANIKAKHEALKEPIRQAKLAAPSRQPVRRGMRPHHPAPPPFRQLGHKMGNGAPQSNILKQTMKMARERHLMMSSKPGGR